MEQQPPEGVTLDLSMLSIQQFTDWILAGPHPTVTALAIPRTTTDLQIVALASVCQRLKTCTSSIKDNNRKGFNVYRTILEQRGIFAAMGLEASINFESFPRSHFEQVLELFAKPLMGASDLYRFKVLLKIVNPRIDEECARLERCSCEVPRCGILLLKGARLPHDITNEQLQNFVRVCPEIEVLELTDCKALTAEGFRAISSLKNLKGLNLEGTNITDEDLRQLISTARQLPALDYQHCPNIHMSDEEMKTLRPI